MKNLEKRISSLEQFKSVSVGPIFIRFATCKSKSQEIERIETGSHAWTRFPNETVLDFKRRVHSEVPLSLTGCAKLFFCY